MASFVDESQLHLKAGDGGAGAVSFRREAHVSRGGPDGGDGGRGGSIYLEASSRISSLLSFKDHPHRRAEDGVHGQGSKKHGRGGDDLVVYLPEGTIVHSLDGAVLADLAAAGDSLVAAQGGHGGHGNARFSSNRLRAPAFAEQGELGEEKWLNLELKLVADVALVGFPNVGKSTLISRISAAKPAIADYPFTTLEPHLGVVRAPGNEEDFVVADIPGLVEGASDGRGLGHQFLRHVERARALLVLADLSPLAEKRPAEQVQILLEELRRYRPELLERPRVVVGSRADLLSSDEREEIEAFGAELLISAVTGEGLTQLVRVLARLVQSARLEVAVRPGAPVLHRPEGEGFLVERRGDVYVVSGREALRAVSVSDLNDPDALAVVHRRLKRIGVDRALSRAGARDGDTVRIGDLSFDYTA